jgi:hypothetical protein
LLLSLAKKITLPLTSDLFNVLLALLCGTKSDLLDFLGEATSASRDKTAKLAKSSETIFQRNSLRGHDLQVVSIPQLLKKTSGVQPPKAFQKDCTNEGTSLDPDGVNYSDL